MTSALGPRYVWEEGKVIAFDDSFEHEVWHNGTELRLILIVDLPHPDLTPKSPWVDPERIVCRVGAIL